MQDEHIVNGDYVLVEKTNTAHDGEIVVALVNGSDATLKRMYPEGDKIRLQPSNVCHAAHRGARRDGADPGTSDRGIAEVLSRAAGMRAFQAKRRTWAVRGGRP